MNIFKRNDWRFEYLNDIRINEAEYIALNSIICKFKRKKYKKMIDLALNMYFNKKMFFELNHSIELNTSNSENIIESDYFNRFSIYVLKTLLLMYLNKYKDIVIYTYINNTDTYNISQLMSIFYGVKNCIDVSLFMNPNKFNASKMKILKNALIYTKGTYQHRYVKYEMCNPDHSEERMRSIFEMITGRYSHGLI